MEFYEQLKKAIRPQGFVDKHRLANIIDYLTHESDDDIVTAHLPLAKARLQDLQEKAEV